MKASMQRIKITPEGQFHLIGYQATYKSRQKPAEGVHDDIYAQPILLETKGKKIFIFQADLIEFEYEFCQEVKAKLNTTYGIDENLVFFSATHNHSAVMDYHKTWSHGVFSQDYYDYLVDVVITSYAQLDKNLVPVHAFYGKTTVEGYYGSRIHLGEKADNDVLLVEFRNQETQEVVAAICNWATHSTVISPENDLLTAEFAGWVGQKIEQYKGYIPAMIVGAAGDSSNRAFRQGVGYEELERISSAVAQAIGEIEVHHSLDVEYEYDHYVEHRVNYVPEVDVEATMEQISEFEAAQDAANTFDEKKVFADRIRALKRRLDLKEVDITLFSSIVKLGDLQWISIPGELGSRYGFDLKKASQAECCLIFGYTNGHFGYLLPEELYGLSFETLGSKYRPQDVDEYVNLIHKHL